MTDRFTAARRVLLSGLLLLCSVAGGHAAEDDALRSVALDYVEGWLTGDEARIARALHPEMRKLRVVRELLSDAESVQELGAEQLLEATRSGAGVGAGPMDYRVAILDRHGDIAVLRVVSSLYVEYLQMVKWQDRWVILSVTWGPLSPREP